MSDTNDTTPVSSDVQPDLPPAHRRGQFAGSTKRTLRKAKRGKKPPRERPPLHTQTLEVLERILPLAEEIKALVKLKKDNGGKLPYGELTGACSRLAPYKYELLRLRKGSSDQGNADEEDEEATDERSNEESKPMHKNGVGFLMKHYHAYHERYKDREPAEAFSPFHKKGRPHGRTLPTEVTDFMKGLWKKRGFQSRNHDGTAAEVDYIPLHVRFFQLRNKLIQHLRRSLLLPMSIMPMKISKKMILLALHMPVKDCRLFDPRSHFKIVISRAYTSNGRAISGRSPSTSVGEGLSAPCAFSILDFIGNNSSIAGRPMPPWPAVWDQTARRKSQRRLCNPHAVSITRSA